MFISGLDLILFAVAIISGLLAMVRGMTREVLSIASWLAAALAALYAFTNFREFARERIDPDALADIALVAGSFIIVLILVSFITMKISDFLGSGPINMVTVAFKLARDTRKSVKSGVVPPVERFDAVDRRQIGRPLGWGECARKAAFQDFENRKVSSQDLGQSCALPAHKFPPTTAIRLMSPDPRRPTSFRRAAVSSAARMFPVNLGHRNTDPSDRHVRVRPAARAAGRSAASDRRRLCAGLPVGAKKLIGVRDPLGMRPLVLGELDDAPRSWRRKPARSTSSARAMCAISSPAKW
jgi:hypothetical protein